ncbi:hypothetical protein Tco_0664354 [Tanacetum coccineum]
MIGNSEDKMPMLAIVDNVHGMAHASSIDNIDHLRIEYLLSLTLLMVRFAYILCKGDFFTGHRILAGQATLGLSGFHAMAYVVPFNFVESYERTTECKNFGRLIKPLQAHTCNADSFLFAMRDLLRPVSWLGNHTKNDYRKPFMEFMVNLFLPVALPFHKKRCCPPELNVGKANT